MPPFWQEWLHCGDTAGGDTSSAGSRRVSICRGDTAGCSHLPVPPCRQPWPWATGGVMSPSHHGDRSVPTPRPCPLSVCATTAGAVPLVPRTRSCVPHPALCPVPSAVSLSVTPPCGGGAGHGTRGRTHRAPVPPRAGQCRSDGPRGSGRYRGLVLLHGAVPGVQPRCWGRSRQNVSGVNPGDDTRCPSRRDTGSAVPSRPCPALFPGTRSRCRSRGYVPA